MSIFNKISTGEILLEWRLIIIAFLSLLIPSVCHSIYRAANSPFPGPKLAKFTIWWFRWRELRDGDMKVIHNAHQKYGPIVQLAPKMISFCHPDALRDIYTGPRGGLDSIDLVWFFEQYGSQNLVSTIDAELHLMRRKNVAGLYTSPVVSSLAVQNVIKTAVNAFMNEIEREAEAEKEGFSSRTVDVFPLIRWLTGDIMTSLVYGSGKPLNLLTNEDSRSEMSELLESNVQQLDSASGAILQWIPLPILKMISPLINPKSNMALFGMSRVQEALKTSSPTPLSESTPPSSSDDEEDGNNRILKSHLQHLLHRFKKNGPTPALPDINYVASDSLDHFFGGSSTTADFLTALIYQLSLPQNKHHQAQLRRELRSTSSKEKNEDSSLQSLQSLPTLTNILRETLRTNPPIPFSLPRVVKPKNKDQNITVMGMKIPVGTTISTQPHTFHRDPTAFPNPDLWDPSRWAVHDPSTEEYRRMQRMFMPFGYGARMCTGMNLAWAIMRLVTARVYSQYETVLDGEVWDGDGDGKKGKKGLYPDKGVLPVVFKRL
ncbi:hypothetical protein AJ79_03795 [Helicocarpus griseus UAMH5409]|uniref:Cytochrome P450 n=1 Tax=Helicocarpus griseus UAMH5409 TaxID=1447875 RepID=A0A2B7XVK9_9EURO|nr:hypothetical protein AJ79_03795 [Helicocarpus griseus UAMH5409]